MAADGSSSFNSAGVPPQVRRAIIPIALVIAAIISCEISPTEHPYLDSLLSFDAVGWAWLSYKGRNVAFAVQALAVVFIQIAKEFLALPPELAYLARWIIYATWAFAAMNAIALCGRLALDVVSPSAPNDKRS